jgi:hypothetical protein
MSESLLKLFQLFGGDLQDLTGVHDIGMGRQAQGGITASEAVNLDANNKLRTALQWVLATQYILRVTRRTQEFCQANFTAGDELRIVGPGNAGKLVKITPESLDAKYDLRLDVITDLPFDRDRRKAEAKELYEIIGPPYTERLLEAYEVPDKDDLLKKIDAWQMIEAAQKVAEQKQKQGEQPNGQATGQEAPGGAAGPAAGAGAQPPEQPAAPAPQTAGGNPG